MRTASRLMIATALLTLPMGMLAMSASATTDSTQQVREAARKPKLVALDFYADWCPACKALTPVYRDLANKTDGQPVLFVTLDQTNKAKARQAEYLIAELGFGDLWSEYGGKTGFVLLVDPDTGTVVDRISARDTLADMTTKVNANLDS